MRKDFDPLEYIIEKIVLSVIKFESKISYITDLKDHVKVLRGFTKKKRSYL